MPVLLVGCQTATAIRLTDSLNADLNTVLIVPVEAPPLEVFPDLLESRMPTYQAFYNMALSIKPEERLFWNQDGIMIAGQVGMGDGIKPANFSETAPAAGGVDGLAPIVSHSDQWLPTHELSQKAITELNAYNILTELSSMFLTLPLDLKYRNANLAHWHHAIASWYEQDRSLIDYRHSTPETVDAVLEIGIGKYKVFHSQTSLQLMIKLIDPKTGKVIAKSSEESRLLFTSAHLLLEHDGAEFKSLILKMGANLIKNAFLGIGLTKKAVPA